MVKAVTIKSSLVYKDTILGVRCQLADGTLVDVEKEVLDNAGIAIAPNIPQELVVLKQGNLITHYEINQGIVIRDGSLDKGLIADLKSRYAIGADRVTIIDFSTKANPPKQSPPKEFTIRKSFEVQPDGTQIPCITPFTIGVSTPTVPPAEKLTKDDVWGIFDIESMTRISKGMVIANSNEICPIFKDKVPYKAVTVVCAKDEEFEVTYWLEYVQGAGCVARRKKSKNGKIALRANYMCW